MIAMIKFGLRKPCYNLIVLVSWALLEYMVCIIDTMVLISLLDMYQLMN